MVSSIIFCDTLIIFMAEKVFWIAENYTLCIYSIGLCNIFLRLFWYSWLRASIFIGSGLQECIYLVYIKKIVLTTIEE